MTNAIPTARPNPLRTQLLGALIATKSAAWTHRVIDPNSPDPKKPLLIETRMSGEELRFPLARNVSALNVERAARRWGK